MSTAAMATTRLAMGSLIVVLALVGLPQPAVAAVWTVTSYLVVSETIEPWYSTCTNTRTCMMYTSTITRTVQPTAATPTAAPITSWTSTYPHSNGDVEVVEVVLGPGAVPASDLMPTGQTLDLDTFTRYAMSVTWTAPASCPNRFTVPTVIEVWPPYQVTPFLTPTSSSTSVLSWGDSTTYVSLFLNAADMPPGAFASATASAFVYTYSIRNCRNPAATAVLPPTVTPFDDPRIHRGCQAAERFGRDWRCDEGTEAWVIAVAAALPAVFALGFAESYLWFRRLMQGRSALRLGTVCWCLLGLWMVLLTRRQGPRSREDQALLERYWATLGFGARLRLWLKWGFRWEYPVELLGQPQGKDAPAERGGVGGNGPNGMQVAQAISNVQAAQPTFMPYPPGPSGYGQPVPAPGQPYPPPPPGFVMPMQPPQAANMAQQSGQPMVVPAPPPGPDGQQQFNPAYVPSPSPALTGTSEAATAPAMQPTPPPETERQASPPPGQPPQ